MIHECKFQFATIMGKHSYICLFCATVMKTCQREKSVLFPLWILEKSSPFKQQQTMSSLPPMSKYWYCQTQQPGEFYRCLLCIIVHWELRVFIIYKIIVQISQRASFLQYGLTVHCRDYRENTVNVCLQLTVWHITIKIESNFKHRICLNSTLAK